MSADRYATQPSRTIDGSRSEFDLSVSVKKATNAEETAPKQKHVRSK